MMGNRGGALHDAARTLGVSRWRTKAWLTCRLAFKGRHRQVMTPRRYTALFFLDEATALAAGHRPCYECRRPDFNRFVACWLAGNRPDHSGPRPPIAILDRQLHQERVGRDRSKITTVVALEEVPDGAFVRLAARPGLCWLVRGAALHPWTPEGYGQAIERARGAKVELLTPPSSARALAAGYRPSIHPSIAARAGSNSSK